MYAWWTDDSSDPGRPLLSNPAVRNLIAAISPDSRPLDLGGVMSLNVFLDALGLVLRVHQVFVSRRRLLGLQAVRKELLKRNLLVPRPTNWRMKPLLRCGNRWAELEEYIPHKRLPHDANSYVWMFEAMGVLHNALKRVVIDVPQPCVATFAPPGSLKRWLNVTRAAVQGEAEAEETANWLQRMTRKLENQWIPASKLEKQLIHGDARLSNVVRSETGEVIYLDFGFLAYRPRVYDLAYALAFMYIARNDDREPEVFDWGSVGRVVGAYEKSAAKPLTKAERQALRPYMASVPMYAAALDGFTEDPSGKLCGRRSFLKLSDWLLSQSDVF